MYILVHHAIHVVTTSQSYEANKIIITSGEVGRKQKEKKRETKALEIAP
jgi:hypothetical protein